MAKAKKKTKKKATKKKTAKKKATKRTPRKSKKPKVTAEDVIVSQIVAMIEEDNLLPWHKPWSHAGIFPTNLLSMKEYRGVNILFLSFYSYRYDGCPYWLTWKQARAVAEAQAKKAGIDIEDGEWRGGVKPEEAKNGYPIVFWGSADKKKDGKVVKDARGNPEKVRFLRYYRVFNVEQCQGIEWPRPTPSAFSPIERCEAIVAGMPAPPSIKHGATGAFYNPGEDLVALPKQTTFHSPEEYYSTMFHELAHSTGHKGRLARKSLMDASYFGSHSYSHEELVAEMASVFVCARAEISSTLNNSAAYLKHWLGQIKEDPRILITSAQAAQKASDWIMDTRYVEKKDAAA